MLLTDILRAMRGMAHDSSDSQELMRQMWLHGWWSEQRDASLWSYKIRVCLCVIFQEKTGRDISLGSCLIRETLGLSTAFPRSQDAGYQIPHYFEHELSACACQKTRLDPTI